MSLLSRAIGFRAFRLRVFVLQGLGFIGFRGLLEGSWLSFSRLNT